MQCESRNHDQHLNIVKKPHMVNDVLHFHAKDMAKVSRNSEFCGSGAGGKWQKLAK